MGKEISSADLKAFAKAFDAAKTNKLAENATARNGVFNAAFDNEALRGLDRKFSVEVKDTGSVTNQKGSGRCWMFAGLNVLRTIAMKKLGLKDLELSESYLMFYDKLEKSNKLLEEVLATLDEPDNSRTFDLINTLGGQQDGGYWSFFVNVVKKYGVAPKQAQPETVPSSASTEMDGVLANLLARDASQLRALHRAGKSAAELAKLKEGYLAEIYRVLAICLGKPVDEFTFEYEKTPDEPKDGQKDAAKAETKPVFTRLVTTPTAFFAKYVGAELDDYVALLNFPGRGYALDEKYVVKTLGNVVGGVPETTLNVALGDLKEAIIASLKAGEVVWFACDVLADSIRKEGYLAADLLDLDGLFATDLNLDKGEQLIYHSVQINHAMTLTGVNLDEKGKPNRWKVENSWGSEVGDKGFFVMDGKWFDRFVYQAIVNKKYLSAKLLALTAKKPIEVEPWAPFNLLLK